MRGRAERSRLVGIGGVIGLVLALLVSGCASPPVSGSVHHEPATKAERRQEPAFFAPPGPQPDADPDEIVNGFLVAMRANPLSVSVARQFLSVAAKRTWATNQGTLTYETYTVAPGDRGVDVRLTDTRRLDARGGWLGGIPGGSEVVHLNLVSEDGQWRIDNPPNQLVVRSSDFESQFTRFNLYFYDQTDRVLMPEQVFIPRGEQTATNLVRGLLAGPSVDTSSIARSSFPVGTTLDLSVTVTDAGVAEVPLSSQLLQLPAPQLERAATQLASTLQQVPGINSFRISVRGVPVPLPDGRIEIPVNRGDDLDAATVGASERLVGVRTDRVVDLDSNPPEPVVGPLGAGGFALRSIAASDSAQSYAAVSQDGQTLYAAPLGAAGTRVTRLVSGAQDLLTPGYDMFGDLWVVDRTQRGARITVFAQGIPEGSGSANSSLRARVLNIPGVTGTRVVAAAVAHDGSRIAFASDAPGGTVVRVVQVLRTEDGRVRSAGSTHALVLPGTDGGRTIDLGWRDTQVLALLSEPREGTARVRYLAADGSPLGPTYTEPGLLRSKSTSLVVTPDTSRPLFVVTSDRRLYELGSNGQWEQSQGKIAAATYTQ